MNLVQSLWGVTLGDTKWLVQWPYGKPLFVQEWAHVPMGPHEEQLGQPRLRTSHCPNSASLNLYNSAYQKCTGRGI